MSEQTTTDTTTPASAEATITEQVPYGPDYNRIVNALLGVHYHVAPIIDQSVYLTPHYTAYQLSDGRVAKIVHLTGSGVIHIYPSYAAWQDVNRRYWTTFPDPETGRVR